MQRRASRPAVSEPVSERAVPASRLIDLTCLRPKQVWSGDWNGRNSLPLTSSGGNLRSTDSARETTEAVGKSFLVLEDQASCSGCVVRQPFQTLRGAIAGTDTPSGGLFVIKLWLIWPDAMRTAAGFFWMKWRCAVPENSNNKWTPEEDSGF